MPQISGFMGGSYCCYCGGDGDGRIIFVNGRASVVDNVFCNSHLQVVCKHTVRRLRKKLSQIAHIDSPKFLIEGWPDRYWKRPYLPTLRQFDDRYQKNKVKYEAMAQLFDFCYTE